MDSHSSKYIYDTLKGDIENNLYSFGSALPSERTLAEKYFVSRTTVRNAIEQLVHDGSMKLRHGYISTFTLNLV